MKIINLNLNTSDATLFYTKEVIQGENLATQLNINLTEEFQGYRYLILFQNNENNSIPTEELTPVNNTISYMLKNNMTKDAGVLKVELQAFDDNGTLIKTATRQLKVTESIDGSTYVIPDVYIPWYVQALQAATTATEQATIATNKALEASNKLDEIITVNTELASNITTGTTLNTNLSANISTGNTTNNNLQTSITEAETIIADGLTIDGGTF